MEVVKCPICEASEQKIKLYTGTDRLLGGEKFYDVLFCRRCELGITNIIVDANYFSEAYPSEYYSRILNLSQLPKNAKPQLDLIAKHTDPRGKRILEVGCADGSLLTLIRQHYDATVFGVEPSEYAANLATSRELIVYKGLEQLDETDFDLIILFDVLEHLDKPVEKIIELRKLLCEGGEIIIGLPNFASIEAKFLGENWFALELPRHLSHFTPKAAELLAEKSNLKLKRIVYPRVSFFYNSFFDKRLKERSGLVDKITRIKGSAKLVRGLEKFMSFLGNRAYMILWLEC